MKTKLALLVTAVTVTMVTASAYADQSTALAGANSNSNSTAVGAIATPTANSLGVGVGQVNVRQNFESSKIPPGIPSASVPGTPVPQIFGGLNAPATVSGIPLILKYEDDCQPIATRGNELRDEFAVGASSKTTITFSPNQNYRNKREVVVTKPQKPKSSWGNDSSYTPDSVVQPVESVRASFPSVAGKYTCLGVLTVVAKKGESGLPFTTILSDARIYPLEKMEGFKDVRLFSVKTAIAAALGVGNSGSGFSISPGISALASNALTGGALSVGYSNGTGGTFADAQIGTTFLVLSPTTDSDGVTIDPDLIRGVNPSTVSAGSDGKKLQAIEK